MNTREKKRAEINQRPAGSGAPGCDSHENLEKMREHAQALLSAADRAISRALSSDSEAFLEATRQEGGE